MNLNLPKKSDLLVAFIISEIDAWLIILISRNIEFSHSLIIFSPLILPVLALLGISIVSCLKEKILAIYQLGKFVLVGTLNTFIDLGILNLLILISGIASGWYYSIFKGASFIIATCNSYLWNKFWSFEKKTKMAGKEFLQFFIISIIGLLINVGVASLVVNVVGTQFGLTTKIWANFGAIIGVLVAFTWNFLGYKFIVFRK